MPDASSDGTIIDPLAMFRDRARELMRQALDHIGTGTDLPLETPPEGMGDFAFPCFALARELRQAPAEIASRIVALISPGPLFSGVEAKGAYVNFHVDPGQMASTVLDAIMERREEYGWWPPTGETIVLEHTSANPNGPLHVGRARNPIIGDTLARLLRKCGHDVTTEFYVDDMGKQQVTLTWGADHLERPAEHREKPDHEMVWYYQEASRLMESDPGVREQVDAMIAAYEAGDRDIAARVRENCQKVLDGMLASLRRLDIHFDSLAWESKYVFDGSVEAVLEKLEAMDCTGRDGGALYLDLESFGITGQERKFYLTRSDGSSLYSTRDVAYHMDKLARYDRAIDVLGEDHRLKARVVGICLELLGQGKPLEPMFYAFVSLPEGKMSTRRGRVVYLDDLIDEAVARARAEVDSRRPDLPEELKRGIAEAVGTGAIRYNIIRVQAEKRMVFRWEEALNFEGNSAPFVQYAHARASGILQKATEMGEHDPTVLRHPSEQALIRAMARFPGLVWKCGQDRTPHPIAAYAQELASLFNQFYRDCPVLAAESEELRNARLALVTAFRYVMANTLDTLGLVAPEEL